MYNIRIISLQSISSYLLRLLNDSYLHLNWLAFNFKPLPTFLSFSPNFQINNLPPQFPDDLRPDLQPIPNPATTTKIHLDPTITAEGATITSETVCRHRSQLVHLLNQINQSSFTLHIFCHRKRSALPSQPATQPHPEDPSPPTSSI